MLIKSLTCSTAVRGKAAVVDICLLYMHQFAKPISGIYAKPRGFE